MVNRSQADINKNVDMIDARQREREFFATSPDYGWTFSQQNGLRISCKTSLKGFVS